MAIGFEMIQACMSGNSAEPKEGVSRESNSPLESRNGIPDEVSLIERVVERQNLINAYLRVVRNKGSAGIDKMTVVELKPYLQKNWAMIRKELLEGRYHPKAVRRVEIPKPTGGTRQLGVPTVVDRLIQQALQQVLGPIFDCDFSRNSYGFRPGKECPRGSSAGAEVPKRRKKMGGGYGLGEIL